MFNRIEYRITFGVEKDRDDQDIALVLQEYRLGQICRMAAKRFGGYTLIQGYGGWIDKTNATPKLVEENGYTLVVSVDDPDDQCEMVDFARWCGRAFNQYSVVVTRGDRSGIFCCDGSSK